MNKEFYYPKISILTPSFNSARTIDRAIRSVLIQGYPNYEHIIIDGNSKDNTVEILKKYNHLIWKSEPDNGQSDAMNKAFSMAKGDIIVYLNADDYFLKDTFKIVSESFICNKTIDIIVGNFIVKSKEDEKVLVSEILYKRILKYYKYIFPYNPVSYFYKKNVQIKYGDFNMNNSFAMDYEFLLYALREFNTLKIEHTFGVFDYHAETKTSKSNPYKECHKLVKVELKNNKIRLIIYYLDRFIHIKILKSKLWYILNNLKHGLNKRLQKLKSCFIKIESA